MLSLLFTTVEECVLYISISSHCWNSHSFYLTAFFCQLDCEQQVSSDESVDVSSPVEDRHADSSPIISSQDHSAIPTQHDANGQLPITESSHDTFTAHVIIEQALHLPTVPGNDGERYYPVFYSSEAYTRY